VEQRVAVLEMTVPQAVEGMRRPFLRAFGRGWVGRRLAASAWSAFRAALLHGSGVTVAASHAHVAAEERNVRMSGVARWSHERVAAAVSRAVQTAADVA
jgi:hypothetical protein